MTILLSSLLVACSGGGNSDDDEDEEIVLDEADEIDLDEDGLSVEVADEFNDEEGEEA